MTESDVIAHWRKGAQDALELAAAALDKGIFSLALFNIHLAIEKALKAQYMEKRRSVPPMTHDLVHIAELLDRKWTKEEQTLLADLTTFAVAARYDDPVWAESEATEEKSSAWLSRATVLLSTLFP